MQQLDDQKELVITQGLHGALWLIPQLYWKQLMSRISGSGSPFVETDLEIVRYFIGHAYSVELEDAHRRFAIPSILIDIAQLRDKCIIVGMVKFFELWNPACYQEHTQKVRDKALKRVSDELGGLIRF